jgi:hypothetical protein
MKIVRIFYLLPMLFLLSCSENSPVDLIEPTPKPVEGQKISYETQVKQIITTNCVSCHGQVSSVNSISLHNFISMKNAILNNGLISRINLDPNITGEAMPQGGPKLSQTNIDLITKWQADGFAQ